MRKYLLLIGVVVLVAITVIPVLAVEEQPIVIFDDGRINNFDVAAPVAVYGTDFAGGRGLEVWAPIGFEGAGVLMLRVTPEEIAAVPLTPEKPTIIASTDELGITLYRLPSGEFELTAVCNCVEQYTLIFEVLGPNTGYTSHFYK